jgi:hypothetical protein
LLIGVTILSLWLGVRVIQAKHEREARRAIAPFARVVHYDFQFGTDGAFLPNAEPPWGKWLREALGDEYFCRMHTVLFSNDVTDSDLLGIRDVLKDASVQSISLAPCQRVTNDGLASVSEIAELRKLDLRTTSVSNEGLRFLGGLGKLQELQLGGLRSLPGGVNDEGLRVLAKLPQLQALYLWGEGFTDSGLVHLKAVPDLRVLWFQDTAVSGQDLSYLGHLKKLEVLALLDCKAGDAELKELRAMPNLKRLYLNSPNITDASVETLRQLPHLEKLSVGKTAMTKSAIAELTNALPNFTNQ